MPTYREPNKSNEFVTGGRALFAMGLILTVAAFLFPTTYPDPNNVGAGELDLATFHSQLEAAQSWIAARAIVTWIADRLVAGGFLMWLAGHIISAMKKDGDE